MSNSGERAADRPRALDRATAPMTNLLISQKPTRVPNIQEPGEN